MKHYWIPALLVSFVLAGLLMFPLRVAWMMAPVIPGLSIADISGTVWNGRATGVSWRGAELGDFAVSISPFDLLPSPRVRIDQGTGPLKSASLRAGARSFEISDASLRIPLSRLDGQFPTTATLRLQNGALEMAQSSCLRASGQILIDDATPNGIGGLTGELSCDSDHLILALLGQAGGRAVLAAPLDSATGLTIREATPELALLLTGAGFGASERDLP